MMRISRFRFLVALLAALALSPAAAPLRAQDKPAATTSAVGDSVSTASPAGDAAVQGTPAPDAPPRTFRAYWHVFVAFTLAWLLVFGYVLTLGRRWRRLEREVDTLRGAPPAS